MAGNLRGLRFPGHLALLDRVLDFLAEAAPEISGPDGVNANSLGFFRAQIRPEADAEREPETEKETEAEAEVDAEAETKAEAEGEAEAEARAEAQAEPEAEAEVTRSSRPFSLAR